MPHTKDHVLHKCKADTKSQEELKYSEHECVDTTEGAACSVE